MPEHHSQQQPSDDGHRVGPQRQALGWVQLVLGGGFFVLFSGMAIGLLFHILGLPRALAYVAWPVVVVLGVLHLVARARQVQEGEREEHESQETQEDTAPPEPGTPEWEALPPWERKNWWQRKEAAWAASQAQRQEATAAASHSLFPWEARLSPWAKGGILLGGAAVILAAVLYFAR